MRVGDIGLECYLSGNSNKRENIPWSSDIHGEHAAVSLTSPVPDSLYTGHIVCSAQVTPGHLKYSAV